MALNTQISYHTRSNSLPSRQHPLASEVDQHLINLRSSQAATATSSTSSSVCHELNGLQDLHDCVDKLLQLPLIQQALSQEKQKKCVDELLNGSLRMLDMYSIAKDALLQTKECVQGLQSVFRRRRVDEISSEVKKYLSSRKAVKKTIKKALKDMVNECSSQINQEQESITMLREVEAVTFAVFESLFSLISGPRTSSKLSGWSLVSKLVQPKRIIACEEEESDMNEFDKVDAALTAHKTSKSDNIIPVLKELESNIQDLEQGLESLSRHLIKSRVSLLNILNN